MTELALYARLYWEFFKTGLFAIGGGMATVPFLQDIAQKTGWYTSADLANMIAVSESTPGPIGINMATYVGYTTGSTLAGSTPFIDALLGIVGAIIATIGLITAPVVIILIVAKFLEQFRDNKYVNAAMYGLRAVSVALIAAAGVSIILISIFRIQNISDWRSAVIDVRCFILAAVVFVATRYIPKVKKWHPIVFILLSAVIGIIFHMGT